MRPRPGQLPDGLRAIGTGLGSNGEPLPNIADVYVGASLAGGINTYNSQQTPIQQLPPPPMQQRECCDVKDYH
jgi:hypothetical protein